MLVPRSIKKESYYLKYFSTVQLIIICLHWSVLRNIASVQESTTFARTVTFLIGSLDLVLCCVCVFNVLFTISCLVYYRTSVLL